MSGRHLRLFVMGALALSAAALAWAPATASAIPTGVTMTASASPATQSAVNRSGVSLFLGFSAAYDDFSTSEQLQEAVFHLDNDFTFDGTGLTSCQRSSIEGKFHNQAVAACPNSIVGSGTAAVNDGAISAVLDAFYGGGTLVYVQADIGPGATNMTITGTVGNSTRGGDFGTQLDLSGIPNSPGLVFTQFNLSFPDREPSPGHHYISARCEADQAWDFAGVFRFYDLSTFMASARQACTSVPTGERAKALKRCERKHRKALKRKREHDALTKPVKKHLRKQLRKCRAKAKKLPV
jgi:hypothetical protein